MIVYTDELVEGVTIKVGNIVYQGIGTVEEIKDKLSLENLPAK